MKKQLMIGLGLVMAAGGLAGCASKTTTAEKKPAAEQAAAPAKPQKEEYVSQTTLGSWIPKKVKKSEAKTSEEETRNAQQAMSELQQRGTSPTPAGN